MPFLFAPAQMPVIPVQDERYEFFPVRRVFGIAAHPFGSPGAAAFMKPADAIVPLADGVVHDFSIAGFGRTDHEIVLAACLSKGGRSLTPEAAEAAVWGWCAGIDFVRRDLERDLCAEGRSWDPARAADRSCMLSYVRPTARTPLPAVTELWLYSNNRKVQQGSTDHGLMTPFEAIAFVSRFWELRPGDVVLTGTPAGSASVRPGDKLEGGVNGVGKVSVRIRE